MSSGLNTAEIRVSLELSGSSPVLKKLTCDFPPNRTDRVANHLDDPKLAMLPQAIAVILVRFKLEQAQTRFTVRAKHETRMQMVKVIKTAKDSSLEQMGPVRSVADGEFLKLFKNSRGKDKNRTIELDVSKLHVRNVTIKHDGNLIEDGNALVKLSTKIAATWNWELADYEFEMEQAPDLKSSEANRDASAIIAPRIAEAIPEKIQKLLDKAETLTEGDRFAEAVPALERALKVSIQAQHKAAEIKVRIQLSTALFEAKEDCVASEEHCRKALSLLENKPSIDRHAALQSLGNMLLFAGRLDEAGAVIRNSLELARDIADEHSVAASLVAISLLERSLGKAAESMERLDEAIQILHRTSLGLEGKKRVSNAHGLGVCYANKAQLAENEGRLDEALALHAKAQEYYDNSGDHLNSGKSYLVIGEIQCKSGNAEAGFQSFKRAMAVFNEVKNPLWIARTTISVARLFAQHEQWEESFGAAMAAKYGFEKAEAAIEHIEAILFMTEILARFKKSNLLEGVQRQVHEICKKIPKELEADTVAGLTLQMERIHVEIAEKIRTDNEIGDLLREAHMLAGKHQLHAERAKCYRLECHLRLTEDDDISRKDLLEMALSSLQIALSTEEVPKRKARLMESIGSLCLELGRTHEWAGWVSRVGEVFEKSGDIHGLASHHLEMAGVCRLQGDIDGQIASLHKALELSQGRTFHDISAAACINLAEQYRLKQVPGKALRLLADAEKICNDHKFHGMIKLIANIRSEIEDDNSSAQVAQHTLPQMLCNLHQLVRFKPSDSTSYLAFWYFTWRSEILALLRSGPDITFMVVSDNVNKFSAFSCRFRNLAKYFALATNTDANVEASAKILSIPPKWLFPAGFKFLFSRKGDVGENSESVEILDEYRPIKVNLVGPAQRVPPYIPVNIEGEGAHFSVMHTPRLPHEALQLMLHRPLKELVKNRVVWFPYLRKESDDPFLSDLSISRERGLFPVYFGRLPTSERVAVVGSTEIHIGQTFLETDCPDGSSRWKRSLLKLTRMSKVDATIALLDLPDSFPSVAAGETITNVRVYLYEFSQLDQKVVYPALLFPQY